MDTPVNGSKPEDEMFTEGVAEGYTGKLAEERADATAESEVPAEEPKPEAKVEEADEKPDEVEEPEKEEASPEGEKSVPYHRFQRVNRELKEVKKKAEEFDRFDTLLKETPGLQEHIQSFLSGEKPKAAPAAPASSSDLTALAKELYGDQAVEFSQLSREEQIVVRQEARLREYELKIQESEAFRKDQAVKSELAKLNSETEEALSDPIFEGIAVDRRSVHKLMLDKGIRTVREAARLLYMDEILEKRSEARATEALKKASAGRSAGAVGNAGKRPVANASSVSFYDDVLSRVAAKNRN